MKFHHACTLPRKTATFWRWLLLSLLILSACTVADEELDSPTSDSDVPAVTREPEDIEEETDEATVELEDTPEAAYGALARQHIVALAEDIGARLPGSAEEAEAAAYIVDVLEGYGYEVETQTFTFTTEDDEELESTNVIAVKPGESEEEIIVGAHYDSVDDADGVDDNASGVAVLLEVASLLQNVPTPYTIRLIAFGAEENDMDGSRTYVEQMDDADIENTVGMINLDSLAAGDVLYVYGDAGEGTLRDWILADAADEGFAVEGRTAAELDNPDGTPCDCADYGPFQEAGIPFAYFEATNWKLSEDALTQVALEFGEEGKIRHTEYDTLAYLDETFPGRVDEHSNVFVTLLYNALTEFQAAD
jgi:hypothetical protein